MDRQDKQRRFLQRPVVTRQTLFQPALQSAKRPELNIEESESLDDDNKKSTPSEYVVPYLKQEGKSGHPLDLNLPQEDTLEEQTLQTPPLGDYEPSLKSKPTFKKSEYISPMGPLDEEEIIDETLLKDDPEIVSLKTHTVTNRQIRTLVGRLQKTPEQFLLFQRVGEL